MRVFSEVRTRSRLRCMYVRPAKLEPHRCTTTYRLHTSCTVPFETRQTSTTCDIVRMYAIGRVSLSANKGFCIFNFRFIDLTAVD